MTQTTHPGVVRLLAAQHQSGEAPAMARTVESIPSLTWHTRHAGGTACASG